jgi:peptidyl-prolyl cis-trans isomerase C
MRKNKMKKLLGVIFLLLLIAIPVKAYMGSSFNEPINVCASHILVPDLIQAEKLKLEINNYEDFQQLARIYSQCPSGQKGGYLGCFGRGQMVKEFEKAAFGSDTDKVVGPVKTKFGYHLIWVNRKY